MKLNYHFKSFCKSITIAVKKLGKNNDFKPNSYWFIALFNILNKFLGFIITTKIKYVTDVYSMFLNTHMEKRKRATVKTVLYIFLKKIHIDKIRKWTITILFLNVSKIFDNVFHQNFLHNFREKKFAIQQYIL